MNTPQTFMLCMAALGVLAVLMLFHSHAPDYNPDGLTKEQYLNMTAEQRDAYDLENLRPILENKK